MKIAYVSSGLGFPSSLSKTTHYAVRELRDMGADVVIGAVDKSSIDEANKEYPLGRFADFYERHKPDAFFVNMSAWASILTDLSVQQEIMNLSRKVKFVLNAIVDAKYVGKRRRMPHYFFHSLLMQNSRIADAIGVKKDRYVIAPLGVNYDLWNPEVEPMPRDEGLGISMVAANHPRKRWDLFTISVIELSKVVKDRVTALAWTTHKGNWALIDMFDGYAGFVNADVPKKVQLYLPDTYSGSFGLKEEYLARVLAGYDMHVLLTYGESFAMPVAETLALGMPNVVIGTDSLKELYSFCDAVLFIEPEWMVPFKTEDTIYYDVSPANVVNALKHAVDRLPELMEKAIKCSEEVKKRFTWRKFARGIIKAVELADKHDNLIVSEHYKIKN